MERWEYAVHTVETSGVFVSGRYDVGRVTADLNTYGMQGWELVGMMPTAGGNGGTVSVGFVFKRRIVEGIGVPPVRR